MTDREAILKEIGLEKIRLDNLAETQRLTNYSVTIMCLFAIDELNILLKRIAALPEKPAMVRWMVEWPNGDSYFYQTEEAANSHGDQNRTQHGYGKAVRRDGQGGKGMTPPRFKVMGKWLTPKQTWINWCIDNYHDLHVWICWIVGHKYEITHQGSDFELCQRCLDFRQIDTSEEYPE